MLRSLEELTPEQRTRNREAAKEMVEDAVYAFTPSAETIPLERRMCGVSNAGEPITFQKARYLRWDPKEEEHVFYIEEHPEGTFFAPMFLCNSGVSVQRIE